MDHPLWGLESARCHHRSCQSRNEAIRRVAEGTEFSHRANNHIRGCWSLCKWHEAGGRRLRTLTIALPLRSANDCSQTHAQKPNPIPLWRQPPAYRLPLPS